MKMSFRTQSGVIIDADPTKEPEPNLMLSDPAVRDDDQLETSPLLRHKIERIVMANSDPKIAGLKICMMLEEHLDLAGNGWFDDDEIVMAEIFADQDEDEHEDD